MFVFTNVAEEEEAEIDAVSIKNTKREKETEELMEDENEISYFVTSIAETTSNEPSFKTSTIEEPQEPGHEKCDFVGKFRTRRHRKVLSSDELNYREGKKVTKNSSSSGRATPRKTTASLRAQLIYCVPSFLGSGVSHFFMFIFHYYLFLSRFLSQRGAQDTQDLLLTGD